MKARLQLEGFKEARTALRKMHPSLVPHLRDGLKDAANRTAVPAAKRRAAADRNPKKKSRSTGKAEASIRVLVSGTNIFLAGGNARVPYFGWRDFGGDLKPKGKRYNTQHRAFLQRGRYLYPGADDAMPELLNAAARAFDLTAREVGFDGS